jgi:hypothetical protein
MTREKLNTKSSINRRLSIAVSAVIRVRTTKTRLQRAEPDVDGAGHTDLTTILRELDHTRPDAKDDSARFAAQSATSPSRNRGGAGLPSNSRNNSGESDSDYPTLG